QTLGVGHVYRAHDLVGGGDRNRVFVGIPCYRINGNREAPMTSGKIHQLKIAQGDFPRPVRDSGGLCIRGLFYLYAPSLPIIQERNNQPLMLRRLCSAAVIVICSALSLNAQVGSGTLQGTVKDKSS